VNIATLEDAVRRVNEAEATLERVKAVRDAYVRDMLAQGAGPTDLARITGLSRERIYQIKSGRR
jgi:hypothetical protein